MNDNSLETANDQLWLIISEVVDSWLDQYERSLYKTSMAEKLKGSLYDQVKALREGI